MSIAARVCEQLAVKESTRPELSRRFGIGQKGLETAMRKLVDLKMIRNTGRARREGSIKLATIFAIGPVEFDQATFSGRESEPISVASRANGSNKAPTKPRNGGGTKTQIMLASVVGAMKPGVIYSANEAAALVGSTRQTVLALLRDGVERRHLEAVGHPTKSGARFALIGTTGVKYGPSIATPLKWIQMTVPLTGDQMQKDRFRELCLLTRRD